MDEERSASAFEGPPKPQDEETPTWEQEQELEEAEAPTQVEPEVNIPEAPPPPPPPPPPEAESRLRRLFRRTLRWAAGLLLVFALGVLTATLGFYVPKVRALQQAEQAQRQAEQQVEALEAKIDALGAQVDSLKAQLEQQQAELDSAELHAQILSALADVSAAQLALANEDPDGARLALSNTPDTLEAMSRLIGSEQIDTVTSMQQRLTLVLAELEDDREAAQSDLSVLSTNLVKLENTFFVEP